MPGRDVIEFVVGAVGALIAAPFVTMGLRRLFAIFLAEGTELFTNLRLKQEDALEVGGFMARLNVVVILVAWLLLLTCRFFHVQHLLQMAVALVGILASVLTSVMVVWSNLEITGRKLWLVALLTFAGGNLPLIVVIGAVLAFM